jgi:hypothetical protein
LHGSINIMPGALAAARPATSHGSGVALLSGSSQPELRNPSVSADSFTVVVRTSKVELRL